MLLVRRINDRQKNKVESVTLLSLFISVVPLDTTRLVSLDFLLLEVQSCRGDGKGVVKHTDCC